MRDETGGGGGTYTPMGPKPGGLSGPYNEMGPKPITSRPSMAGTNPMFKPKPNSAYNKMRPGGRRNVIRPKGNIIGPSRDILSKRGL